MREVRSAQQSRSASQFGTMLEDAPSREAEKHDKSSKGRNRKLELTSSELAAFGNGSKSIAAIAWDEQIERDALTGRLENGRGNLRKDMRLRSGALLRGCVRVS